MAAFAELLDDEGERLSNAPATSAAQLTEWGGALAYEVMAMNNHPGQGDNTTCPQSQCPSLALVGMPCREISKTYTFSALQQSST